MTDRAAILRQHLIEAILQTDAAPEVEEAENIADDIISTAAWKVLLIAARRGSTDD